jgi:hypothetical protein
MQDQVFEAFRKASASFVQMQQDLFKQWTQQWPTVPLEIAGASGEWLQKFQKRWLEFTTDSLNMHRQSLDSMYGAAIEIMSQAFKLSESTTPEDYQRATGDLRRKIFETFKAQSESQLREMEKEVEKWFELFPTPTNGAEKVH